MRRFMIVFIVLAVFSTAVFAQEFKISGEAKSGILWEKFENQIEPTERTNAGSLDDAGSGAGRFRLNAEYANGDFGFKTRIQWDQWNSAPQSPLWPYAFGYGNFFGNQLTMSIGKLGASPWGTGGPEMWKELEAVANTGGIRFEIKPSVVPGLNVGFVLNGFNAGTDQYPADAPITFLHVLEETVIGASYTHDYFHVRFAYRFDSEVDYNRGTPSGKEGGELVYRLEERILGQYLPGFQVWALGYFYGIGAAEANKIDYQTVNWLMIEYAPDNFTAQVRLGFDQIYNRTIFYVTPSFYYNLFGKKLVFGALLKYGQDYGDGKLFAGSPYAFIEAEPKVQFNFTPNAYVAFAYIWRREYVHLSQQHIDRGIAEPIEQRQKMNLRFGIIF